VSAKGIIKLILNIPINASNGAREMGSKMSRLCLLVIGALFIVLTGSETQSEAGVNVNVGDDGVNVTVGGEGVNVSVGTNLPAVRFAAPPDVVLIPGTYVYIVPDMDVDVLFFQGYWWRPYKGHWYRSQEYNGQWSHVEPERIPGGLRALPQDYRDRLSPGYDRIPHDDVKRNWNQWEKEKHWDRRTGQGKDEQGEHDYGRQREQERERR
jgi:hypothetical protein